jgi:hypothetical protein
MYVWHYTAGLLLYKHSVMYMAKDRPQGIKVYLLYLLYTSIYASCSVFYQAGHTGQTYDTESKPTKTTPTKSNDNSNSTTTTPNLQRNNSESPNLQRNLNTTTIHRSQRSDETWKQQRKKSKSKSKSNEMKQRSKTWKLQRKKQKQ